MERGGPMSLMQIYQKGILHQDSDLTLSEGET